MGSVVGQALPPHFEKISSNYIFFFFFWMWLNYKAISQLPPFQPPTIALKSVSNTKCQQIKFIVKLFYSTLEIKWERYSPMKYLIVPIYGWLGEIKKKKNTGGVTLAHKPCGFPFIFSQKIKMKKDFESSIIHVPRSC